MSDDDVLEVTLIHDGRTVKTTSAEIERVAQKVLSAQGMDITQERHMANLAMTDEQAKAQRVEFISKMAAVHIFGQPFEHCDVFIVCNPLGLEKLQGLLSLDRTGGSHVTVSVADGEGYNIYLCVVDNETMDGIAEPYTSESAEEKSDVKNDATRELFRGCMTNAKEADNAQGIRG